MSRLTSFMDAKLYPDHGDRWDDALFRQVISSYIHPEHRVLDIGAGAGRVAEMHFREMAREVCGLDPDPRVLENPHLDDGRVGRGEEIPWPDAKFDLVFCDNVLEHLEHPEDVFREVHRVLTPGGRFLFKTPNRRHYVAWIADHTPTWFHKVVNRLRGRPIADTFPTLYRANSPEVIRDLSARVGFDVLDVQLVEGRPEYLRMTPPTYLVGAIWERAVNGIDQFEAYRGVLIGVLVKPHL